MITFFNKNLSGDELSLQKFECVSVWLVFGYFLFLRFGEVTCLSICMEETWEHVSVRWQQGKFQLWANSFMSRCPVSSAGLKIWKTPSAAYCYVQRLNHSAMTRPPKKTGLAPAKPYHTLNTTLSRFWGGTNLHWTVYTWHWCIDIVLYAEDMRTRLRSFSDSKVHGANMGPIWGR